MKKWVREFRLIPVLLIAAGGLFALKSLGLILDGGYTLGQRLGSNALVVTTVPVPPTTELRSPAAALEVAAAPSGGSKPSWMQEVFNYPDVTGSVPAKPKEASKEAPKEAPKEASKETPKEPAKQVTGGDKAGKPLAPPPETKAAAGTVIPLDQSRPVSATERALLERLQERRQELDARARELDLRESLLKEAEKKLEAETAGQKANEARDGTPAQRKEDAGSARLKSVVTMYETMKPKDAAKIFDRLDIRVLLDVAGQINPRRMSEILAQMSPEAAERLTVELAARSGGERTINPSNLPKIEGRPSGG
jgi:flagellar motility protein MotE (MotC chaperone)